MSENKIKKYLFALLRGNLSALMAADSDYALITASGIFDSKFYLDTYPDVKAAGIDPLMHFVTCGWHEKRNPHFFFHTRSYLAKYPEVAQLNINPLVHYLKSGAKEGKNPHDCFITRYYEENYNSIIPHGTNPLSHYIANSLTIRLSPYPLFDAEFYVNKYPEILDQKLDPFIHYLTQGIKKGYQPSEIFDPVYYFEQANIQNMTINPMQHYLHHGEKEGFFPHPYFDPNYYLSAHPHLLERRNSALTDYLTKWDSRREPHILLHHGTMALDDERLNNNIPIIYINKKENEHIKLNPWNIKPLSKTIYDLLSSVRVQESLADYASEIKFPSVTDPEVSIVIPVYNNIRYTLRCLKTIELNSVGITYEVIIIDDASTDESNKILSTIPNLKYIRNESNQGFLRSCNIAAAAAKGNYIHLLNNDTCVLFNWLRPLVNCFTAYQNIGLVGSKLVFPNGRLQEAGGIIWPDASGWNWGRSDFAESYEYNYIRDVDYCSGASIMVPTKVWKRLSGFDEKYAPAYYEDTDFAFRVREAGCRTIYQPQSTVVHFEGISCGKSLDSGVKAFQVKNKETFKDRWNNALVTFIDKTNTRKSFLHRNAKRHALFIDTQTPTPDCDSGSNDIFQFMRIFQAKGFAVTFMPQNLIYMPKYTEPLQQLGIECVYRPFSNSLEEYLQNEGARFDLVMIYRAPCAAQYLDSVIAFCPNAKVVFDTVDLHFLRLEREANIENSIEKLESASLLKVQEIRAIQKADLSIIISAEEDNIVKKIMPNLRTQVIPIVRDLPHEKNTFDKRKDIFFIGGFGHPPNIDAVHYLIDDIWPLVENKLPGVNLVIIGSKPPENIKAYERHNIKVLGYIEDPKEIFLKYRVSVAPLRYGAGMKGKVVDSMSYGVPCVVSTIAAEGMGLTPGTDVLVSDNTPEFAEHIVRLYNDSTLWNTLSNNGIKYCKDTISVEAVSDKIQLMLDNLGIS